MFFSDLREQSAEIRNNVQSMTNSFETREGEVALSDFGFDLKIHIKQYTSREQPLRVYYKSNFAEF